MKIGPFRRRRREHRERQRARSRRRKRTQVVHGRKTKRKKSGWWQDANQCVFSLLSLSVCVCVCARVLFEFYDECIFFV
jgi:hypothetical protein